ncbi:hypothetical protein N0V90_001677 [Kalmusia sp. IMI 367209]|nr:hypothetical protein N0V90_001677 [Kalmusia sp. IMI 367209]
MKLTPSDWRRQAEPIPTPTRINLGPLTTLFVQPPHCSRAALAGTQAILGQSCHPNGATASAADDTGCWPRATAYPTNVQSSLNGMGFYSPGVMCPTGYHSACTAISTSKGMTAAAPQVTGKFQFPLVAGETAVGCCPNGYTCGANGGAQTCHQVATKTKFDAMTCDGLTGSNLDAFQVPTTMGAETIATMDLWAPMIQINHMATDLPETEVSSTAMSTLESTETPSASTPRTKTSAAASVTPTPTDAIVRVKDVETEEASTSTRKTKTSVTASATQTDDAVRVKDVNTDEPSSTANDKETTSEASKTSSTNKTVDEAAVTDAPASSSTIAIATDPAAVAAPAGPAASDGLLLDTRLPPPMPSSMFATPTFTAAAADSTALPAAEQSQTSFSTGAKVGVACAPLAGAALILLGIFYYKRRKQNTDDLKDSDAKSFSSDSTAASIHQTTYFGGSQADKGGISNDQHLYAFPAPAPAHNSPYNEDRKSYEMAMNGPGPAVIAPSGYGDSTNKMTPADFYANPWSERDEYETRPFETAASRFKHAHSLSDESGSMESPIDGTSPFRLKRGNTLKGREKLESRLTGQGNERHVSIEGQIVTPNGDRDSSDNSRSSQEAVEWGEKDTLKRSNSFSRPRPRPKTTASSVYPDDRDSIMSWDAAMAPDMPDKPLPSIPEKGGLDRSKSFSRPRPKRDDSADTLVEGRTTNLPSSVVPPPVTAEGVSF